jgi:hypothetical protein
MDKLLAFINGKKTYITAVLIGLGACATALGYVIPEWVWALLGAIGLGSVRAAIKK